MARSGRVVIVSFLCIKCECARKRIRQLGWAFLFFYAKMVQLETSINNTQMQCTCSYTHQLNTLSESFRIHFSFERVWGHWRIKRKEKERTWKRENILSRTNDTFALVTYGVIKTCIYSLWIMFVFCALFCNCFCHRLHSLHSFSSHVYCVGICSFPVESYTLCGWTLFARKWETIRGRTMNMGRKTPKTMLKLSST